MGVVVLLLASVDIEAALVTEDEMEELVVELVD